jgi:hypothetical protein
MINAELKDQLRKIFNKGINSKHEIRNSKQFLISNTQTKYFEILMIVFCNLFRI